MSKYIADLVFTMSLFLEQNGKLIRLDRTMAKSEKEDLQKFILKHPEIIPVDALEKNENSFIEYIVPEFNNIDVLALSNSGNIYIIETKRSSGDYKRAVGQGLTYAALLWSNYGLSDEPVTEFIEDFNKHVEEIFEKDGWKDLQLNKIEEVDGKFLKNLDNELKEGLFTVIIVVDKIDEVLKNTINFLNKQFGKNLDIYAMELEYYIHEGIRIVKPHIYGLEYREASISHKRRQWNEELFLKAIDENGELAEEQKEAIKEIYYSLKQLAEEHSGKINWGTGGTYGWAGLSLPQITTKAIFGITTTGGFSVNHKLLASILRQKPELWKEVENKLEHLVKQGASKGTELITTKSELITRYKEEIKQLAKWITQQLTKLKTNTT